ncbi:MAG: LysM peptidoglycan-binding domain-containing protein [Woeseia sp.]|nr:LysM peptidoglycan-binding domain-containing protein [Woeseia sp.]MBT8095537.1 LysM peptidoglycan-binding domain-containing protein [Woeseia sp.]NNL55862.1 LysM peptidoglycan-binding domain-containing protein [Woeseia sp.]
MKVHNAQNSTLAKPAMLAAGSACVLLAYPAMAVELGELRLQSALGQPLRASVAFALAPNEKINDQCVYLNSVTPGQGLPLVNRATASINGQQIILRGNTPLREPMMSLQLAVNCPYTAKVSREYLLLLNPASMQESNVSTSVPAARETTTPAPVVAERRPVNTFIAPPRNTTPVSAGSDYRVQTGDTLSEIAARIPDRKVGLWNAVGRIFDANPQAFLNSDIDQLIAGATLQIPSTVTSGAQVALSAAPAVVPVTDVAARSRAYNGAATRQTVTPAAGQEQARALQPSTQIAVPAARNNTSLGQTAVSTDAAESTVTPAVPETAAPDSTVADVAATIEQAAPVAASPAVEPTVGIPDTRIEQVQPRPIPVAAESESSASSWLVWLGGAGIAIFLALLFFGRRLRELLARDEDVADLAATQVSAVAVREPMDLSQTISKASAMQVEEILAETASFDTGEDVDVALDYSFSSSSKLDKDVDFVVDDENNSDTELATRLMPTAKKTSPSAEEDDYDMSMVLDVTRQNFRVPEQTASDLDATEIASGKSATASNISPESSTSFDYKILEQDYEDELTATQTLTATQALSGAVDDAARELQKRAVSDAPADSQIAPELDADSSQMSMATDLDSTAEITADLPKVALTDDSPTDAYQALEGDANLPDETDLTEALAASMEELDLEFDIDDDDDTEVLGLEETAKQRQSKAS